MMRDRFLRRMTSFGIVLCGISVGAVACGDAGSSLGPLPPIVTTTTTTTTIATTTTAPPTYQIQKGDTLGKIAKRFGITTAELKLANGITNANHIEIGQTLVIPRPGEIKVPTTPKATTTSSTSTTTTTMYVAGASTTWVP